MRLRSGRIDRGRTMKPDAEEGQFEPGHLVLQLPEQRGAPAITTPGTATRARSRDRDTPGRMKGIPIVSV